MGKRSQEVQRARREALVTPEIMEDLLANPPLRKGDAMGSIQFQCFITGKVHRWTVLRGSRSNNYQLRTPDGRCSKPHGMAWILDHLRPVLLHHASFLSP